MAASIHIAKNCFKQIFADGWAEFKRKYPRYEAVDEVVQKMLGCGDPANGHAIYVCPDCQAQCVVGFSCKSQFCLCRWYNAAVRPIRSSLQGHLAIQLVAWSVVCSTLFPIICRICDT